MFMHLIHTLWIILQSAISYPTYTLAILSLSCIFIYLNDIIGACLSYILSYKLRKAIQKSGYKYLSPIKVTIRSVKWKPITFYDVCIQDKASNINLQIPQLIIHTHIKDFFWSFGVQRMLQIEFSNIQWNVVIQKDNLLQYIARQYALKRNMKKGSVQMRVPNRKMTNFTSYLWFIDIHIQKFQAIIKVEYLDTELIVSFKNAWVTGDEVQVQKNHVLVKVLADDIQVYAKPFEIPAQAKANESEENEYQGFICHIPYFRSIFEMDYRKRSQILTGWKFQGDGKSINKLNIAFWYIESILTKCTNLIHDISCITDSLTTTGNQELEEKREGLKPDPIIKDRINLDIQSCTISLGFELGQRVSSKVLNIFVFFERILVEEPDICGNNIGKSNCTFNCSSIQVSTQYYNHANKELLANISLLNISQEIKIDQIQSNNIEIDSIKVDVSIPVLSILDTIRTKTSTLKVLFANFNHAKVLLYKTGHSQTTNLIEYSSRRKISLFLRSWRVTIAIDEQSDVESNEILLCGRVMCYQHTTSTISGSMSLMKDSQMTQIEEILIIAPVYQQNKQITGKVYTMHCTDAELSYEGGLTSSGKKLTAHMNTLAINRVARQPQDIENLDYLEWGLNLKHNDTLSPNALFNDIWIQQSQIINEINEFHTIVDINFEEAECKWDHCEHAAALIEIRTLQYTLQQILCKLQSNSSPSKAPSKVPDNSKHIASHHKTVSWTVKAEKCLLTLINVSDVAKTVEISAKHIVIIQNMSKPTRVERTITCDTTSITFEQVQYIAQISMMKYNEICDISHTCEIAIIKTIDMQEADVRLIPQCRLLLLYYRIEELFSKKISPYHGGQGKSQIPTFPDRQLIIHCHKSSTTLYDTAIPSSKPFCTISLLELVIDTKVSRSYQMTEPIMQFLHIIPRGKDAYEDFERTLRYAVRFDGTFSIENFAVTLSQPSIYELASGESVQTRFCVTNVLRNKLQEQKDEYPEIITIFDTSLLMLSCALYIQTNAFKIFSSKIMPRLFEAINTRQNMNQNYNSMLPNSIPWRHKYAGTFDVACESAKITIPYGQQEGNIANKGNEVPTACRGLGEKLMVLHANYIALNCRQLQKVSFQYQEIRLSLLDNATTRANDTAVSTRHSHVEDPIRLLYFPRSKLDLVLHWQDKNSPAYDNSIPSTTSQLAISLEFNMTGHRNAQFNQVPIEEEAWITLAWDYIYPLLVYFITEDDAPFTSGELCSHKSTSSLKITGIQWQITIDTIQLIWWNSVTSDAPLHWMADDLVSHGIARNLKCGTTYPSPTSTSTWVIWEATLYIDTTRGYLLKENCSVKTAKLAEPRSPQSDEKTVVSQQVQNSANACKLLPFEFTSASNFFFEAVGISFRKLFVPSQDFEGYRETSDAFACATMFTDLSYLVVKKMHQSFNPIPCHYSVAWANWMHSSQSPTRKVKERHRQCDTPDFSRCQPITKESASPSSPPKSPRSWHQTIQLKLTQLKRRTTSMDNMSLNDGSCPIQVDSMKLLWTLETRDSVFYMVSVVLESLQLLKVESINQESPSFEQTNNLHIQTEDQTSIGKSKMSQNATSNQKADINTTPIIIDTAESEVPRRGSKRETLLELLQQGKLGNTLSPPNNHLQGLSSPSSSSTSTSHEGEKVATIDRKLYTIDVHDAQICLFDEASGSRVLVAANHTHVESGIDASDSINVATVCFEAVTAHIAPTNAPTDTGVPWYGQSCKPSTKSNISPRSKSRRMPTKSPSGQLKQVMKECTIYTTYSDVIKTRVTNVGVDLSFMQLSLDRFQFYQMLNVVRHVLLAPPRLIKSVAKGDNQALSSKNQVLSSFAGCQSYNQATRKKMLSKIIEAIKSQEAKTLAISSNSRDSQLPLKTISFRGLGCQLRLRTPAEVTAAIGAGSPEYEFIEIRIDGISGAHTFLASQTTTFTLNLKWFEVNNLRPGPSSIAFEDAMTVLKAQLLVHDNWTLGANRKGMLAVRAESRPIRRVNGQKLRILDVLEISSFPEIPSMIVIQLASDFYDLLYRFFFEKPPTGYGSSGSAGNESVSSPASTRSNALLVTQSSCPSNIAIPGTHHSNSSGETFHNRQRANSSFDTNNSVAVSPKSNPSRAPNVILKSTTTNHLMLEFAEIQPMAASPEYNPFNTASSPSASLSCNLTSSTISVGDDDEDETVTSVEEDELCYLKYVRVGNIKLRIHCNGFFVNLSDFDLDLPPFVLQSKLCTWKKLIQKFESHLKWHITKESASSTVSHFKNKLKLKWPSASPSREKALDRTGNSRFPMRMKGLLTVGASTSNSSFKSKEDEARQASEDLANMQANAQVLFGPYSGETRAVKTISIDTSCENKLDSTS